MNPVSLKTTFATFPSLCITASVPGSPGARRKWKRWLAYRYQHGFWRALMAIGRLVTLSEKTFLVSHVTTSSASSCLSSLSTSFGFVGSNHHRFFAVPAAIAMASRRPNTTLHVLRNKLIPSFKPLFVCPSEWRNFIRLAAEAYSIFDEPALSSLSSRHGVENGPNTPSRFPDAAGTVSCNAESNPKRVRRGCASLYLSYSPFPQKGVCVCTCDGYFGLGRRFICFASVCVEGAAHHLSRCFTCC